jgi:hypothetical protein
MDQATLDHCKAWIDCMCSGLRSEIGPLDDKGAVQNLTVDMAMAVRAHNELLSLRWHLDAQTPVGYEPSPQMYINDADMQNLRHLTGT